MEFIPIGYKSEWGPSKNQIKRLKCKTVSTGCQVIVKAHPDFQSGEIKRHFKMKFDRNFNVHKVDIVTKTKNKETILFMTH